MTKTCCRNASCFKIRLYDLQINIVMQIFSSINALIICEGIQRYFPITLIKNRIPLRGILGNKRSWHIVPTVLIGKQIICKEP